MPLCSAGSLRHHGAPMVHYADPRNPFAFLPYQGVDCKPGRRHILHWPMSARGRKLYPPQKGSLSHVSSALLHSVHGTHMPTVHLYVRFRALAGKVPVVCCRSRLHSTMSRYLLVVWQLYAAVGAVEWSPGIAISAIATRHAADPAASS